MQHHAGARRPFVFTGSLKKHASVFPGSHNLWQTRLFGLEGAAHNPLHSVSDAGSSEQKDCALVYALSDDAESLQDCAHTGRIILTKSSSVSVSDQDHTQFTLEHVRYGHKVSEKSRIELRAESWSIRDRWVDAITTEIEALRVTTNHVVAHDLTSIAGSAEHAVAPAKHPLRAFADLPCNSVCADCGASAPRWASVTHQVLICVACSGVHRNLGRHISFVQGLFNDEWSEDSLSAFLSSQGNELRNSQLLEYHVPPSFRKPNASSERETREVYITAKCASRTKIKFATPLCLILNGAFAARSPQVQLQAFHPCAGLPPLAPVTVPVIANQSRRLSKGEIRYVGVLWVTVQSCHNLVNKDVIGLSDPYAILTLGANNRPQTSPVVNNDLNPVFNWKAGPFTWNGVDPVNIRLFDKDDVFDDSLGFVDIPLGEDDFASNSNIFREMELNGVAHGSIKVSVSYDKLD